MSRWQTLRAGKRSVRPLSEEEPLVQSIVVADYLDDNDGSNPITDATVRNEIISQGQFVFQPFVNIQHTWRCGVLNVQYGFTVSGSGVLTIDNTLFGTGTLFV